MDTRLGPTPMTTVNLDGCETKALLDTGSPVTIVSLQFLLQALARQRQFGQTSAAWKVMVEEARTIHCHPAEL